MLAPMLHFSEVQCQDDDWSGLRDRKERRRRQNRLNVRAHRKRNAVKACQKGKGSTAMVAHSARELLELDHSLSSGLQIVYWNPPEGQDNLILRTTESSGYEKENSPKRQSGENEGGASSSHSSIRQISQLPQISNSELAERVPLYSQKPTSRLPLYRDHLIPLVYYNVFRATITNIHILSLTSLLASSCTPELHQAILFPSPSTFPPTLLPTTLQSATPHESWIDIFPSSTMRDNAIKFRANYDHHDLCNDLIGYQKGDTCPGQPGIVAWSDPWHPDGWEVTESFIEKWGFLLKGCKDVMNATNRWRALRDEEPLIWDLE